MAFNLQDKKEYISYLEEEIRKEQRKIETIFTNHYIHNLNNDLFNMKKLINK